MRKVNLYPELYYSDGVSNVLKSRPILPSAPIAPIKPQYPIKPADYDNGNRGCFIIELIGAVVLLIYILSSDIEGKFGVVVAGAVVVLGAYFLLKTDKIEEESHEEKLREYNDAVNDYPRILSKYNDDYAEYLKEKQDYDAKIRRLTSKPALKIYREKKMKLWRNKRIKPNYSDCETSDIVKKGVSERFFADYLAECGYCVYVDKKIPVGSTFYYPDILVVYDNIYVDIEIDEPYVGNDGTPIHYLEKDYMINKSIDSDRNNYMNEKGFEVIRFSEEQVFLFTPKCVDFIELVLKAIITGNDDVEFPDDFCVSKWTKDQASKLAYQRFRNTYVPAEYQQFISKEEYRTYAQIRAEMEG